jgi:transposase InsO family protein
LVSGANAEEHLQNLRALFQRLNDNGLRCKMEKCTFAQPTVEYLGHMLTRDGIAKGPKVDAILKMPPPTSVQFYGKFLPNLSTIEKPLNDLLKKTTQWPWGAHEQSAFQQLKDLLSSDTVLAHFDPTLPIGIATDTSDVGVRAVLFHHYSDGSERPIANVSKTLSDTQRRYSQVQKEALAVIFGLKKFHSFLYGRPFILVTDHKPLLALFGPNKPTPALAANRLARWALLLSQYDYTIEYHKTQHHGNADVLSRLPAGPDASFDVGEDDDDASTVCQIVKTISLSLNSEDVNLLAKETSKDAVFSTLLRYVRDGWLKECETEELQHYKKSADFIMMEAGCLFYGNRVMIPLPIRCKVLDILHTAHPGMQRMKQLARTAVYWFNIDSEIEQVSRTCTSCAEHQNRPEKAPLHPWMLPEKPWMRVHIDHAINFLGTDWLVLVDAYSKYPCIHATNSLSSKTTIELLREDFAHFGFPFTIVSDNATCFKSDEFQFFCKTNGITHLTGAPYHPATNGAAERLVQTFKQALRKLTLKPKQALQEFLMIYRRTPLACGYSPSELLNSRQIRTQLDALRPSLAHSLQGRQVKDAQKPR